MGMRGGKLGIVHSNQHISSLQTEEPQKAPASSGLHQNYLGDVKPSGIMRNFCGRLPPPHQAGWLVVIRSEKLGWY